MYQLFHMELDLIFTRLTPCEMVDAYIGYIINFFHIREEASMEIFSGVAQTLVVRTLIVITRFLEGARREPNFLEWSNEEVKELDDGTN